MAELNFTSDNGSSYQNGFRNSTDSGSIDISDYFLKFSAALASLILTLLSSAMFWGVIWFERYGLDKKRTLINKLVSSICWNFLFWNLTIQMVTAARIVTGPLNYPICSW